MGNQTSADTGRKYGWRRDNPDCRDNIKYISIVNNNTINDLRNKCPPVYEQLNLGSCTANAIAFAYQFDEKDKEFIPSRLFIYYNERKIENTIDSDSGASLRDGIKTIHNIGVCKEDDWVYDPNNYTDKPPAFCYKEAKLHRSIKYHRIMQELHQFKACIKSGFPFVFGFSVYESFENPEVASTGIMPIPQKKEKLLGGHAVAAVGFDDSKKAMIIRNSWGENWGDKGYFYMPYKFIVNPSFCSDFWVVKKVKDISETINDENDGNDGKDGNDGNDGKDGKDGTVNVPEYPEILSDNRENDDHDNDDNNDDDNNDDNNDDEFEIEKGNFDSNDSPNKKNLPSPPQGYRQKLDTINFVI